MQRGPLLQPLRSTELVLSGPPRARKLAELSTGRLTAARTASASSASSCLPCPDTQKEANPPAGRVFLSAFSPKKPHSFLRGKPRFAPLSPRPVASLCGLTPFPQSCHGFVLAPSSRQKPRQPRVLAIKWVGGEVTPEPSPTKTGARSGPATRGGEPRLSVQPHAGRVRTLPRVFSGPGSSVPGNSHIPRRRAPFGGGFGSCRFASSPFRLPCRGRGLLGIRISPAAIPPLGVTAFRYTASARPKSFLPRAPSFKNTVQPCAVKSSNPWSELFQPLEPHAEFFPTLGTAMSEFFQSLENHQSAFTNAWGPPLRVPPPYKLGPRALRALLFPDIYREIETP